jgi:hypothetical protein
MTPRLQSLCNLAPIYPRSRAQRPWAVLIRVVVPAHHWPSSHSPSPCITPAQINRTHQQQCFQQQQHNTSSATSRSQSFDFQDQSYSSSLQANEWTFSSGTTSHSTSGNSSGSSTHHSSTHQTESVAHKLTSKFLITRRKREDGHHRCTSRTGCAIRSAHYFALLQIQDRTCREKVVTFLFTTSH